MLTTKCKARTDQGKLCPAKTWELQVGKGMLAQTVARSEQWCIRHDRGEYAAALLALTEQQGNHLRYKTDWDRWQSLRPAARTP